VGCYGGASNYESRERELLASLVEKRGLHFRSFTLGDLAGHLLREREPIALMTVTCAQAQRVIDQCRQHDLAVPDSVAVVGVWDNPLLCNSGPVPITAIDLDEDCMGYEAGCMLEAMLCGQAPPDEVQVPAVRVVPRKSSSTVAQATPSVRRAVNFIRERYQDGIQVTDVVRAVNCGRTTLYREFKRCVGQSIAHYIAAVRVEQAKQVLQDTEWTLDQVALEVGLESRCALHHTFSRIVGQSPGRFRRDCETRLVRSA
jgi:LacI family transcriptional regulator